MKLAVVGSKTIEIELKDHIPDDTEYLISGGAKGIDSCVMRFISFDFALLQSDIIDLKVNCDIPFGSDMPSARYVPPRRNAYNVKSCHENRDSFYLHYISGISMVTSLPSFAERTIPSMIAWL